MKKRWKILDQAKLLKRLGIFLNKGYPLIQAIELLMIYENERKKKDLRFLIEKLKQGIPLSDALHAIQYANEGVSYIFFAEQYGTLSEGLLQAGQMLEMKVMYKKDIAKILRYPLFLIFFLLLLLFILHYILIPQFSTLYHSLNLPPTGMIAFALSFQYILPIVFYSFFFFSILLLLLFLYYFRKKSRTEQYRFLCKMPLIRYFIKKYTTYFFAFHFGNLLNSGLAIHDALTVFENQWHIAFLKEEAKRLREQLLEGEKLETLLKATPYYDQQLATIIIHGQANGNLSGELLDYSQLIMDQLEATFSGWIRMIQPTIIVFIGLFVIALYLVIMFPLYGIMRSL